MKAVYIESFAPHGNIKIGEVPKPKVEPGEVGIIVAYAGVNPVDAKVSEKGCFNHACPTDFPLS